jgi:hypothetical protein
MEAAMNRLRKLSVVAFAYVVLAGGSAASSETVTDTNVVTGVDFSHSVSLDEHWIVQDGLAKALLSPEFLRAIQAGRHGRIGLALFGWHTTTLPLLPWMLVSSAGDAELAAQRVRAAFIEQIATEATLRRVERRFGRPTDLSHALSSATAMLLAAPFRSTRSVINIIGNGPDNINEGAQAERAVALDLGFTINGVVLGHDPDVIDYFRQDVVGGPGSFVEHVPSSEMMTEVFRRKFINDIVVGFADGSEPKPNH